MGRKPNHDQKQYIFLKQCISENRIQDWNDWREKNPNVRILLYGADFETDFPNGAKFWNVNLGHANLANAKLRKSSFHSADLSYADLHGVKIQSSKIGLTIIQNTDFRLCSVDNDSTIAECIVGRNTDFRYTPIGSCNITPSNKALIQCVIRRKTWEEWYKKQKCIVKLPVWLFWELSDYGKSPKNLFISFFSISGISALIYCICGWFCEPGIVSNVFNNSYFPQNPILTFFKTWFFSIVTMVSLGGYSYLKPINGWGNILLSMQLISGYVILGALVTYLGILYNSDGPAGKYADEVGMWRWVKHYARRGRHGFWHMWRGIRR